MGRLAQELRRRFASPRDALRALGLDEDLLAQDHSMVGKRRRYRMAMDEEAQGEGQRAAERMHDRPLTSLHAALDKLMRRHAHDDHPIMAEISGLMNRERDAGSSTIPRKIETMGPEDLSAGGAAEDDEGGGGYEDFKEHLRQNTRMSEDEIEEACEMAKDVVRRRSSNGRDRLPRNRLKGGAGGHFGGGRTSRDEVNEMRSQMGRIETQPTIATGPISPSHQISHHGMDASPTARQRSRTLSRFPGMARVGDMSGPGMEAPGGVDLRSSTERKYDIARIGIG